METLIFYAHLDTIREILKWAGCKRELNTCETTFTRCNHIHIVKGKHEESTAMLQGEAKVRFELPEEVVLHIYAAENCGHSVFYTARYYLNVVFDGYCQLMNTGSKPRIPYDTLRNLERINSCISNHSIVGIYDLPEHIVFLFGGDDNAFSAYCTLPKDELPDTFISHLLYSAQSLPPPWTNAFMKKEEKKIITKEDPILTNTKKEKENKTMNMKMPAMNFEFGPAGEDVALSPYGIAIRNGNQWLTYNPAASKTVDVTGFSFDFQGMLMKMPAPLGDVRPGDVVMHQGNPMFVTNVDNNSISAVDIKASEAKNILPVTNMFGFNYVTKIVSFLNFGGGGIGTPSPDQPFGNIMPMIFWSQMFNGSGEDGGFFGMGNGNQGNMLCQMAQMSFMGSMMGQGNPFGNMFNFNFGGNQENKEG